MASITSWTRLEPRVRRDEPSAGLEARVRDPLWMLARQWQVGEFTAEDAGSPLQVRARVERAPLTRYFPGPLPEAATQGEPDDPEPAPARGTRRAGGRAHGCALSCETGLHFLRLLEARGVGRYRQAYVDAIPAFRARVGTPLGDETLRTLRVSTGRVPDGARLAVDLRAAGDSPA